MSKTATFCVTEVSREEGGNGSNHIPLSHYSRLRQWHQSEAATLVMAINVSFE